MLEPRGNIHFFITYLKSSTSPPFIVLSIILFVFIQISVWPHYNDSQDPICGYGIMVNSTWNHEELTHYNETSTNTTDSQINIIQCECYSFYASKRINVSNYIVNSCVYKRKSLYVASWFEWYPLTGFSGWGYFYTDNYSLGILQCIFTTCALGTILIVNKSQVEDYCMKYTSYLISCITIIMWFISSVLFSVGEIKDFEGYELGS